MALVVFVVVVVAILVVVLGVVVVVAVVAVGVEPDWSVGGIATWSRHCAYRPLKV